MLRGLKTHRRIWIRIALLMGLLFCCTGASARNVTEEGFTIGLTSVFLNDQTSFLRDWRTYLETRLGKPVNFIQRQTYREITEMLLKDRLDVAWICGYPYIRHWKQLRLLAVPLFNGEPLYQSYIIVPADDEGTEDITDLGGAIFAYSDPDSNSGYLVPQVQLLKAEHDPKEFFRKAFFTWNHRDVVVAVAEGLAQGGAVDGYVWDTLAQMQPELTKRTRVVAKSKKFGFPPFVSRPGLPYDDFQRIRRILTDMATDPEGQDLLKRLNLDGFTWGNDHLFEGIRSAALLLDRE